MNFLKFLETKGLTLEQFKLKTESEKTALNKEHSDALEVAATKTNDALEALKKDNEATKEALQDAINANHDAQTESNKALVAIVKEQGLALKSLIEAGAPREERGTLMTEIKSNMDSLKTIASTISKDEVQLKTLVTRASVTNNEQAFDLPEIGQLAHRKMNAFDIFPKLAITGSNNNGVIRYYDWDSASITRAAAAVAEGAAFPESTAVFVKKSLNIEKIGDTLPVTEEFFEDEAMFAAELNMFLLTNVDLVIDNQIINGTGTSNQLKGLVTVAPAFTPAASGISDASIYDLIVKVTEEILAGQNSKYQPDFALMNIIDINAMKLKKDANDNYVMPPFVSRDGNEVAGIVIIEDNAVVANTMFVGDRRFGRIYQVGGVTVSQGTVGTQFTEDEMTIKVRKRLCFLIRDADNQGFREVTSISAALVTLAS